MPALIWFGRRWCIASDDLPLPASLGLLVHLAWSSVLLTGLASIAVTRRCEDAAMFTTFVAEMLACFAAGAVLFAGLVWYSSRGAMHETQKRRMVPSLLYCLVIDYAFLLLTSIYGTTMVLTHVPSCYQDDLSRQAVRITKWVVIASWAVVAALVVGVILSFNVYHDFRDERNWQASCRCVAMCFCCQPEAMTSQEDGRPPPLVRVASFFNSMFAHIDMTVSDVVACLLLLNLDQSSNRQTSSSSQGSAAALLGHETSTSSSSTYEEPQVPVRLEDLEEALHYHKYALAAYGWMMYVWTHRGKADKCCRLCVNGCFSCCLPLARDRPHVPRVFRTQDLDLMRGSRGNLLSRRVASFTPRLPSYTHSLHRSTILETSGIQPRHLMYVNYVNLVAGRLPYFIALDEVKRCVVVAIRGSLSVEDCLTDVLCEPEVMDEAWLTGAYAAGSAPVQVLVEGSEQTGDSVMLAHHGMMKSARAILADLDRHNILRALLENDEEAAEKLNHAYKRDCRGWRLVLVGHSLGSGVAALLSFPLRMRYPNIKCWLFAPPGGVLSPAAAARLDTIAVSLIHAEDIVPRISMGAVERLRDQLVEVGVRCRYSKLMLLLHAVFGIQLNREKLFAPLADVPPTVHQVYQQFQESVAASRHHLGTYQPARAFVTPGRLLYLERISDKLLDGSVVAQYIPRWISRMELGSQGLRICPTSFTDHLPDVQIHNLAAVVDHMQGRSARSRASLLQTVVTLFSASRSASMASQSNSSTNGSRQPTPIVEYARSGSGGSQSLRASFMDGRVRSISGHSAGGGGRRIRGGRSVTGASRFSTLDVDNHGTVPQNIVEVRGENGGRLNGTSQHVANNETSMPFGSLNTNKDSSVHGGSTRSNDAFSDEHDMSIESNRIPHISGSSSNALLPLQLLSPKPQSPSTEPHVTCEAVDVEAGSKVISGDVQVLVDDVLGSGIQHTQPQSNASRSHTNFQMEDVGQGFGMYEPGAQSSSGSVDKRRWGRRKSASITSVPGRMKLLEIPLDVVSPEGTREASSVVVDTNDKPLIDLSSPMKGLSPGLCETDVDISVGMTNMSESEQHPFTLNVGDESGTQMNADGVGLIEISSLDGGVDDAVKSTVQQVSPPLEVLRSIIDK